MPTIVLPDRTGDDAISVSLPARVGTVAGQDASDVEITGGTATLDELYVKDDEGNPVRVGVVNGALYTD